MVRFAWLIELHNHAIIRLKRNPVHKEKRELPGFEDWQDFRLQFDPHFQVVDELDERGLIAVSPGVEDKRVVKIKMTPKFDVISRCMGYTLSQAGETIADSLSVLERRDPVKIGGELDS